MREVKARTHCSRCKGTGPFGKNRGMKNGIHCWCRACVNEVRKAWRKANPTKAHAWKRKWEKEHPEEYREQIKRMHLKKYGLTTELYDQMLQKQDGRCANPGCRL